MDETDLTQFLQDWPYQSGRINVRRITGEDGRPKLQLRMDLGVLQMEVHGRPDGERPEGFDSLLEYQKDRLRRYAEHADAGGFVLSPEECRALRDEALQYYHRYVGLFAIEDYLGVIADTMRNLEVFNLCREYAATEMDRAAVEQFRPGILMMRARAEAELAVSKGRPKDALAAIDAGLEQLRATYEDSGRGGQFEHANEVKFLRSMRDTLVPKLPSSQRVELEERLRAALVAENYELAAILRDELWILSD